MPALITLKAKGNIKVKEGEKITPETVLAEEEYIPEVISINLSKIFSLPPKKCLKILKKKLGSEVTKNELIAQKRALLGLKKKNLKSPCSGVLEKLDEGTGELLISLPKIKKKIKFPLNGKVKRIEKGEITIVVDGEEIKLKEGFGNFCFGEIFVFEEEKVDIFTLNKNITGKILVGKIWEEGAVEKAIGLEALAIIAEEIKDLDLSDFKERKDLFFNEKEEGIVYNLGILEKEEFKNIKKIKGKKGAFFPEEKKLVII